MRLRAEKNQLRGQCPACGGADGREISINTKLKSFHCHSAKQGGSLIDLAAHILGCEFRDAAEHLQKMFGQCPMRSTSSKMTKKSEDEAGMEKGRSGESFPDRPHPRVSVRCSHFPDIPAPFPSARPGLPTTRAGTLRSRLRTGRRNYETWTSVFTIQQPVTIIKVMNVAATALTIMR